MARARRRNGKKSPDSGVAEEPEDGPAAAEATESAVVQSGTQAQDGDDTCPACVGHDMRQWAAADKENWVRCDACKTWYHWRCAGDGSDLDAIDKWFCKACMEQDRTRTITLKPPARKSARKKTQRDYAGLHNTGSEAGPHKWLRMLEGKKISGDPFRRMKGAEVGEEWLENDESAMREPIVIESPEGLGMKMPPKSFTVADVAEAVGEDHPVEVIDVATQSNTPGWTLAKWAEYYAQEPSARDKIRNVISLEITGTELADKVLPPKLVRELDWVEKFWPSTKKGRGNAYPKVQLYCLMGVAGAWTDWHIDFAGSSVYYHILHGTKVFYFIRPTPANLAAYERWSGTEMQNHQWLGDLCDEVFKVELHDGNTMIIPTGWIHAVYTPEDTLVFGGNFLHSYNVSVQLKVREIEINTHVPKKFRFPHFVKLCWYAAEKYLRDLKAKEEFSSRVLESVEVLANFLVAEARAIERGSDHAKREAKEQVPNDRVKDAPALARELRWRVRLARGEPSDDEGRGHRKLIKSTGSVDSLSNGAGTKRKRSPVAEDAAMFRNFTPRQWERVINEPVHRESRVVKAGRPAPNGEDWKTRWAEWNGDDDGKAEEGAQEAHVERRKDVIVKVRKTEKGIERQRVERVVEMWVWEGGDPPTVSPAGGDSAGKAKEDSAGDSHPNGHGLDVTTSPDDPMPQAEPHTAVA
ncbi:hypothetical protein FOMPIDRAFT_152091 [Fomitopsis schrenkii]|uniref:JmjC domain-containing histone demethylation protein 1 n=1 Tax=Fomitopsis schrenkii TaxID=2126942 RepID=S8EA08_FOMSC|nr:hypothetical protein FOMPIDRAFT_152091 [Fomitopsis schrenkii]